MGKLFVRDLVIECIIGIHPHERVQPQCISLDIELEYDFSAAVESDDICDVVDCDPLVQELRKFISESRFLLIERLAQRSAEFILESNPQVSGVLVRIRKLEALSGANYYGVEVSLPRESIRAKGIPE